MVASTTASMVWKSKKNQDPLSSLLFPEKSERTIESTMVLRSSESNNAKLPVPGHGTLAANLMARSWNEAPNVQSASSLGAAKSAARKWAKSLPIET